MAAPEGEENLKRLLSAFKNNGFKVTGREPEYKAKASAKVDAEMMKKILKESGWKSQGKSLFPDADGEYYFQASSSDGDDSQAVYNSRTGDLYALSEGNW